jgi:DNA-binding MarR family transcriptional regulator
MPNAADTPASGQSADTSPAPELNPTAETDALAIANQLRPVLLRLHRFLRGEAHEMGVTSTQASLLAAMHRSPGVGLSELARREHMSAPTLVGHVDRLEAAGLVARERGNPTDLRRVGLTLTPAGLEMLQTLRARRTAWLTARLEALAPDELAAVAAAVAPLRRLTEGES